MPTPSSSTFSNTASSSSLPLSSNPSPPDLQYPPFSRLRTPSATCPDELLLQATTSAVHAAATYPSGQPRSRLSISTTVVADDETMQTDNNNNNNNNNTDVARSRQPQPHSTSSSHLVIHEDDQHRSGISSVSRDATMSPPLGFSAATVGHAMNSILDEDKQRPLSQSHSTRQQSLLFDNRTAEDLVPDKRNQSDVARSDICEYDDLAIPMGSYPTQRLCPDPPSSFLHPGSIFRGSQQSERTIHEVQVEIKHVDLEESYLCGYLRIKGLTPEHPSLTTFFEGEIIGSKHGFITQNPEWGATEKVDLSHWSKFTAFRPFQRQVRKGPVVIRDLAQRENIFMRWKEHFLVPNHRVKTIAGASFEGFYYICFNQVKGEITGIYFHSKSERFQQLELHHVEDRGCFSAVEFR